MKRKKEEGRKRKGKIRKRKKLKNEKKNICLEIQLKEKKKQDLIKKIVNI